MYLMK